MARIVYEVVVGLSDGIQAGVDFLKIYAKEGIPSYPPLSMVADAATMLGTMTTLGQAALRSLPVPPSSTALGALGIVGGLANSVSLGSDMAKIDQAIREKNMNLAIEGALGFVASASGIAGVFIPAFIPVNLAFTAAKLGWQSWLIPERQQFIRDMGNNLLDLPNSISRSFNIARSWSRPSDPLILDLDGDGIELTASSSAVLFDHNADGIKTGTQWVHSDDGILVRDLNGNGQIDSGRELFGDQSQFLYPDNRGVVRPVLAYNGFEALRRLESNGDGRITAQDSAFADLRVWRDFNQDGISQSDELQTLAQVGITQINLHERPGDGLTPASELGVSAESTGQASFNINGATQTVRNINFTTNTFYREFPDEVPVVAAALDLPDMKGSGLVRDLREAMSLTAASGQLTDTALALQNAVTAFSNAETTQQRQQLLDQVIFSWGNTSGLKPSGSRPWIDEVERRRADERVSTGSGSGGGGGGGAAAPQIRINEEAALRGWANSGSELSLRLLALERFNGQTILERYLVFNGYDAYLIRIEPERVDLFNRAYESLSKAAYESLYTQTRGLELLDKVDLSFENNAFGLDFTRLNAEFAAQRVQNPAQAAIELAEFVRINGSGLGLNGWDGVAQLSEQFETLTLTSEQLQTLRNIGYKPNASLGTVDSEILIGSAGEDVILGGAGSDVLIGGSANDFIQGGAGNDSLLGGVGDDQLNGEFGDDTYFWGQGQGNDQIFDTLTTVNGFNAVVMRGLRPADVSIQRGSELDRGYIRFSIIASGETLTVHTLNGVTGTAAPIYFHFTDGTAWSLEDAIRNSIAQPTNGDDILVGSYLGDLPAKLAGGGGNDIIIGGGGADVIEGGAGNDVLWGAGFIPSAGAQPVFNASNNDPDTYVFGRGDGQDIINDLDASLNSVDVLRFKPGVALADIELVQSNLDLVVKIRGTTDQVTVSNHFQAQSLASWFAPNSRANAIERFEFADGTFMNLAQIDEAVWRGTSGADRLVGDSLANRISGAEGADLISGLGGDDRLEGGDGDDQLMGDDGDDLLVGGAGNDILSAGQGRDTIIFGRGDGHDTLRADFDQTEQWRRSSQGLAWIATGNNVVQLKEGVSAQNVRLRLGSELKYSGYATAAQVDLVIEIVDQKGRVTDSLTVSNAVRAPESNSTLTTSDFSLQEIRFFDGTVWLGQDLLAQSMLGDASSQFIRGFGSDDLLDGRGGNDVLNGGAGRNTYLFGLGDGHDSVQWAGDTRVLQFKPGVLPSNVDVRRVENSIVFTVRNTGDSIALENVSGNAGRYGSSGLEEVAFADGTSWDFAKVAELATLATAGDDTLIDVLHAETTTLEGGLGNDELLSYEGSTTYVFNRGDGKDTILERSFASGQIDTVRFGAGIAVSDLRVTAENNDLIIALIGTQDSVRLREFSAQRIERYEIGGAVLNYDNIRSLLQGTRADVIIGTSGNDVLAGSEASDQIIGLDGDDQLAGGAGSDTLEGGLGNDVLAGGTDRDLLKGGTGSTTYVMQRGSGLDTIELVENEVPIISFGVGITPADISVQRALAYNFNTAQYEADPASIVIGFGGNDAVSVRATDTFAIASLESLTVQFSDGSTLGWQTLVALADDGIAGEQQVYYGGPNVLGSQTDDVIDVYIADPGTLVDGRGNDDTINLNVRNVMAAGGLGNDAIYANQGSILAGQGGNDQLGGGSNTVIAFNANDGKDTISYAGANSTLSFGLGINPTDIRLRLDSTAGQLVMSLLGNSQDEVRIGCDTEGSPAAISKLEVSWLQFIDLTGGAIHFDLEQLLGELRFDLLDNGALLGDNQTVFSLDQALTTPRGIEGGLAAIAYAQTGDLRGATNLAVNAQQSGNNTLFGTNADDLIDAGLGNDIVMAGEGNDEIDAGDGNDFLDGQDGDDILAAGLGDDLLMGGAGNDTLHGGQGFDKAYGGAGDDTYIFLRGDGYLYVEDTGDAVFGGGEGGDYEGGYTPESINTLQFGIGITLADLSFSRVNDNLVISVSGSATNDRIVLHSFDSERVTLTRSVEVILFDDGTELNLAQAVESGAIALNLSTSNEGEIVGTALSETLTGSNGSDMLDGGQGNDRLVGGQGDDVYLIGADSGNDTVIDQAGQSNVLVFQGATTALSLRLEVSGGVAQLVHDDGVITLAGWDGQRVENAPLRSVVFADGSTLTIDQLFAQRRRITGTAANDVLTGSIGDDTIEGLQANDEMAGGAGNDTYIIGANAGHDTIVDVSTLSGQNTLLFQHLTDDSGVRLSVNEVGDLVVHTAPGASVTLTNFDRTNALGRTRTVEYFQFGTVVLSYEDLLARGFDTRGTSANDTLLGTNLRDVISAGAGDDSIDSGPGGDVVSGGAGNDSYVYRQGDGLLTINDLADNSGGNVLRFGPGITPDSLNRKLRFDNNTFQIVFDTDNQISISGFDPTNPRDSAHGIEQFAFEDGSILSWDELLDRVFVVEGGNAPDSLSGTTRSDRLYGYAGNDVLRASAGDDVVTGGTGNDQLLGGLDSDNYVFELGDGNDVIIDGHDLNNAITFGLGITRADIRASTNTLGETVIRYGGLGDTITIRGNDGSSASEVISNIFFTDGTNVTLQELSNLAPTIGTVLQSQNGRTTQSLSFTLPSSAFVDPENSGIRLSANLDGGASLPNWLVFDPLSGQFSGTPPAGAEGAYTVRVFGVDPLGAFASQAFMLTVAPTVDQVNSAPLTNNDTAVVIEDSSTIASGNVLANDADADGDSLAVVNSGQYSGTLGQLSLSADGTYSYTLNNSAAIVQSLGVGQQLSEAFEYSVTDGKETRTASLTVTISGTNDGPVVVADVLSVREDTAITASGNALSNDFDIDTGDALTIATSSVGTMVGAYGSLLLNANGDHVYTLKNTAANVQGLRAGERAVDRFTYAVTDGIASTQSTLEVFVTGENDGPTAATDSAGVQEDVSLSATGNVLANDTDADIGDALSVTSNSIGTFTGSYGTLVLNGNGSYVYALNNLAANVQGLKAGQQVVDSFSYGVTDGIASSMSTLEISVSGSREPLLAVSDSENLQEDIKLTSTGNVLANDRGDDLQVASSSLGVAAGTYGSLTLGTSGDYRYSLNNDSGLVQGLRAGQQVVDRFTYSVTDGVSDASTTLSFAVTGVNDLPIGISDSATVKEDVLLTAAGNLLNNDSDVDAGDSLSVASSSVGSFTGVYGTLGVAASGAYSYTLNNSSVALQALGAGQVATEVFNYGLIDSAGGQASSQLTVNVQGLNDAPILVSPVSDVVVNAGELLTIDLPDTIFKEIDRDDTLRYEASLSGGAALPSWLVFNSNGLVFTGIPPQNFSNQFLDVQLSAIDSFGAKVSDVFRISVTSGVGLNLTGTAGNDVLTGSAYNDFLDGGLGTDLMIGGKGDDRFVVDNIGDVVTEFLNEGNDTVYASVSYATAANVENLILTGNATQATGNSANNVLVGNVLANSLFAGEGNDLLAGGGGADELNGGAGNDVYLWTQGDGRDSITDSSGADAIRFGQGISIDSIAVREYTVGTQRRAFVSILDANGEEQANQGIDFALTPTGSPIERFEFAGGTSLTYAQVKLQAVNTYGGNGNDAITGGRADDIIDGGNGDDVLRGLYGNDTLLGGNGNDRLFGDAGADSLNGGNGDDLLYGGYGNDSLAGENGNDLLWAGFGNDSLSGGNGDDVLAGGAGDDSLNGDNGNDVIVGGAGADNVNASNGNDFIDSGSGNDIIDTGLGNDFIAAGKGNDTISTSLGTDIIAFNKGDGADTYLASSNKSDVLSLGGGIRYADLKLSKVANDLILCMGNGDQILFKNWYASGLALRSASTMQVITDAAGGDFNASSSDRMLNRRVVQFNFSTLVQAFDTARGSAASLSNWSATSSLNGAYMSGSNTLAVGGDLSYRYATLNNASNAESTYGSLSTANVITQLSGLNASLVSLTANQGIVVSPWAALQAGTDLAAESNTGASLPIQVLNPLSQDDLVVLALNTQQAVTGQAKPTWVAP